MFEIHLTGLCLSHLLSGLVELEELEVDYIIIKLTEASSAK